VCNFDGFILKKILVTGANGFLGRAVSEELILKGFDVLCAVRRPFLLDGASTLRISDLEEQNDWSSSLDGIDCIIHTAARVHIMDDAARNPFEEFHKVNVIGTLNLAQQAATHGVKRFIFLSSIKVNGEYTEPGKPFKDDDVPNPQDDYSLSKHQAEKGLFLIAQKTGMEIVVIRPPLVYGPSVKANFESMMKALQRGIPLPFGAIHNKRSFVYIGNLVNLILRCIDHPAAANQVFFVSDGWDLSTTELLNACATALAVKARLLPVPQSWIGYGAGLLGKHKVAQRLCGSLQADITKTCRYLDWTPPFSLAEGLKATALSMPSGLHSERFMGVSKNSKISLITMKRLFDLLLALVAIIFFGVPLLLLALLIKLTSKGSILYWSDRVGRDNEIFRMPKFRSMQTDTPAVATHLLNDPGRYLTSVGGFLRRTSLDELPQLWSIIKGDMSFVGPRPALFNQDDLIALRSQSGVIHLLPGLTGWAQVNGRDELPIPQKVKLDVEYMQRKSFVFDLYVLWLTFLKVIRGDGVSH